MNGGRPRGRVRITNSKSDRAPRRSVRCFKFCFCGVGHALRDMRASRIVQQAQDVFLIGRDLDQLDDNVVIGV